MFTKAVLDGIRARHKRFADRMERDGLKPIGFLGGGTNRPEIEDYEVADSSNGRTLRLHISFPKHANANILKGEDRVKRVVPLLLDADDRPAQGTTFSLQVNAQVFTGTVGHRGDMWHIDFTVT